MGYDDAPYWATPLPTELRRTLPELRRTPAELRAASYLSYVAEPYWAMGHLSWATAHPTELRRTLLSYAPPCFITL